MKLSKLILVEQPKPVEPEWKMCIACEAFMAECYLPSGEPACWLCAHHIVEHGAPISAAHCAECECTPYEVYPHRRAAIDEPFRMVHGDSMKMKHPDDWKSCHMYNPNTGCMDTWYRGELVDSTPIAPVREHASRLKPT